MLQMPSWLQLLSAFDLVYWALCGILFDKICRLTLRFEVKSRSIYCLDSKNYAYFVVFWVISVVLCIFMYEKNRMKKNDIAFVGLGLLLVIIGHFIGLFVAPKEAMMGDVGRILYVHVPTAWVALLTYLIAFVVGIGSLWTGKRLGCYLRSKFGSGCLVEYYAYNTRKYLGQTNLGYLVDLGSEIDNNCHHGFVFYRCYSAASIDHKCSKKSHLFNAVGAIVCFR